MPKDEKIVKYFFLISYQNTTVGGFCPYFVHVGKGGCKMSTLVHLRGGGGLKIG